MLGALINVRLAEQEAGQTFIYLFCLCVSRMTSQSWPLSSITLTTVQRSSWSAC